MILTDVASLTEQLAVVNFPLIETNGEMAKPPGLCLPIAYGKHLFDAQTGKGTGWQCRRLRCRKSSNCFLVN